MCLNTAQYIDAVCPTEVFLISHAKMVPHKFQSISSKSLVVKWLRYLACTCLSQGSNLGVEFEVCMLVVFFCNQMLGMVKV
jgi:hypothetical protein